MKALLKLSLLALLTTLASCSGGGGGGSTGGGVYYPPTTGGGSTGGGSTGGGSTSTYGAYQSANILASEFVSSLNSVDSTYSSRVELYTNETLRSQTAGQDDWFVIYDAKFSEYKAVSLIRTGRNYLLLLAHRRLIFLLQLLIFQGSESSPLQGSHPKFLG